MLSKLSANSQVRNILVVSLTNIGDVIMTCPVLDQLKALYPQAQLSVVIGPKAASLFEGHKDLRIFIFDKHAPWRERLAFLLRLQQQRFDTVIDLRNTAVTLFLLPKYGTHPLVFPKGQHLKERLMSCLGAVYKGDLKATTLPFALSFTDDDKTFIHNTVLNQTQQRGIVVLGIGAADSAKRFSPQRFAKVADAIYERGLIAVIAAHASENDLTKSVVTNMTHPCLVLEGKLSLRQLGCLMTQSKGVIAHDSGLMHLASYLNVPVLALFGPTDPKVSGPWSRSSLYLRHNQECQRCLNLGNESQGHTCMNGISVEDVIEGLTQLHIIT